VAYRFLITLCILPILPAYAAESRGTEAGQAFAAYCLPAGGMKALAAHAAKDGLRDLPHKPARLPDGAKGFDDIWGLPRPSGIMMLSGSEVVAKDGGRRFDCTLFASGASVDDAQQALGGIATPPGVTVAELGGGVLISVSDFGQ
jgi:hypothetical protein